MNLKTAIKGKIIAGDNKYNTQQQKSAIVIETNQSDNYCTISLITRDGIQQVFYKVPVLYEKDNGGTITWFPTKGEEVRVLENNKNYTIMGPVISRPTVNTSFDIYSYGSLDSGGFIQ